MLKITAVNAESFNEIKNALDEFDEQEIFLKYFDTAVQSEADVENVTVILRNNKKFKKDLNKKKYIVNIPTTLTIDAFEIVKKYETKGGKRVPFYSVLIKGHLAVSEVSIILILVGFNDDAIRILSFDDYSSEEISSEDESTAIHTLTNRDMYNFYNQPEPLSGVPNCDDSEEDFIIDTLV